VSRTSHRRTQVTSAGTLNQMSKEACWYSICRLLNVPHCQYDLLPCNLPRIYSRTDDGIGYLFHKSVWVFNNATVTTTYKSYDRSQRFSEYASCSLGKAVQFQKATFPMQLLARRALHHWAEHQILYMSCRYAREGGEWYRIGSRKKCMS